MRGCEKECVRGNVLISCVEDMSRSVLVKREGGGRECYVSPSSACKGREEMCC